MRRMRLNANRFFPMITQRKLRAADKVLEIIKKEMKTTEWQRGYINALEGMLLALKSKDRDIFIKKLTPKNIGEAKKKFFRHSRNTLQADFDKGFFTAWEDYEKVLKNLPVGDENDED